jgi:hypothetical protein
MGPNRRDPSGLLPRTATCSANPAYAEAIVSARSVVPAPWRVSVRRPPGASGPGSPSYRSGPRRAEIAAGEEESAGNPDAPDVETEAEAEREGTP